MFGQCGNVIFGNIILLFFVAKFNIRIEHLQGVLNGDADSLSRNKSSLLFLDNVTSM